MGNVYARLEEATPEERDYANDYLSFDDPKARFLHAVKRGYWDGRIRLMSQASGIFPSGNVPQLVKAATEELGVAPIVEDTRVCPMIPNLSADISWLAADPKFAWQLDVVQKAAAAQRGILWVPTGGGKTNIAVGLAQLIPCKWLFIVHTTKLMYQAAERFEDLLGWQAGRIGDGVWSEHRFTTATFQTLWKAVRNKDPRAVALLPTIEGLFVDECHTLPADTFFRVVMRMANAYWRFGLSGTPLARGDKRSIYSVAALGPVVARVRAEDLFQLGVLARPKIRMLSIDQPAEYPTWQGTYGALVVRSHLRNRTLVEAVKLAAKPCLVFVKEIRHGRVLKDAFLKSGLRCEFTWGQKANAQRDASIKSLERGDIDVLICSVIFQEGVDIPSLASVVIACGGRSAIAAIQRIGRGTRSDGGRKQEVEVIDCYDTGNKLMARHAQERRAAYRRESYEVTVCKPPT